MAGFPNIGSTCYANSALKFLIHSAGPQRLRRHLVEVVASGDALHREAAMRFAQVIESSYSEAGTTPAQLQELLASLQQLPAFAPRNAAGEWHFPLLHKQQDAPEFLARLSQAFALDKLYACSAVLHDGANQFKTDEEYWTVLQPAHAQASLQEVLDQTPPASWRITPGNDLRQLAVRLDCTVHDLQSPFPSGSANFDFNETVRLRATDCNHRTWTLTLEPREVIAFRGCDNAGHNLVYVKDSQWFRHDDAQVEALARMPAIENVRMINFAVTRVEPAS